MRFHAVLRASTLVMILASIASAQDRLKAMPIYPHYTQMRTLIESATRFESPQPIWSRPSSRSRPR